MLRWRVRNVLGVSLPVFSHLGVQPLSFTSDRSKIAYLLTLMSGRVLGLGSCGVGTTLCCFSLEEFVAEVKTFLDYSLSGREAAQELLQLHQDCGGLCG
jgi:hypothetical protein